MSDLCPNLQEVRDLFMNSYTEGGVEACRDLVANLAVEAEFMSIICGDVSEARVEMVENSKTGDDIGSKMTPQILKGFIQDKRNADSRHTFARIMLVSTEKIIAS